MIGRAGLGALALLGVAAAPVQAELPAGGDTLARIVSQVCLPQVLGKLSIAQPDSAALKALGLTVPADVPETLRRAAMPPASIRRMAGGGIDAWIVVDGDGRRCDAFVYGGPVDAARRQLVKYLETSGGWTPLARLTQIFDGKSRQVFERFAPDKSEVALFMTTPEHPDTVTDQHPLTLVTVAYVPPQ